MASAKDTFAPHTFAGNTFAAGVFRGSFTAIPTVPGIELKARDTRLHYEAHNTRVHYETPED